MTEDAINALIEAGDRLSSMLAIYELDLSDRPMMLTDVQSVRRNWSDAAQQAATTVGADEES